MRRTLIALLLLPALARADAGDQLWRFQGIEDIQAMGHLPDVDGDGVAEVLVETYDAGADGDHLYLLSGGSGDPPAVIWSTRPVSGASNGGGWGEDCLEVCPDLSGDGFPDVLLGTAWGNRSVHAVDGRTGDVLWTFDTYLEFDSGWVYDVSPMPDRTGDGLPEVVCAVGSDNDGGYLLDGADGAVLWRFGAAQDALFIALPLPDMNGDTVADVLFCAGDNDHRVYCVSGLTGSTIWLRDTGASNQAARAIDDLDGDGLPEIAVGNWGAANQVKCLDGATGDVVWQFHNGSYQYAMRLVNIGDAGGDGHADLALGSFDNAVRAIDGATGDLLWESYAGTTNGGDFWTVDAVGDLDADGVMEVVGGSFDTRVYLFSGAAGDTLWQFPTGKRLYTVRGGPDLDGSGLPDVLAGTQYLSGGGWAYALAGAGDLTGAGEIPFARGFADRPRPGGPVTLSWDCDEALEFNVYRVNPPAAAARDLVARHAAGELSRDALLAARRAGPAAPAPLNAAPLGPEEFSAGIAHYGFEDPAAPDWPELRYELRALLAGGETLLLTLEPAPRPPTISAAELHPNPFNPRTEIVFQLTERAEVTLRVLDMRGRELRRWEPKLYAAGRNRVAWEAVDPRGRPLASGVYLVSVEALGERRGARAVLLK